MWNKIFRFLSSLQLAVIVILGLAIALAVGTIIESKFDIRTGRYWVYHTIWFDLLLTFLGLNILFVALSRYPWKRKHIPFLTAHLGILILLFGSFLTQKFGLDGSLLVDEGKRNAIVEMPKPVLYISRNSDDTGKKVFVPWVPSHVKFKPKKILGGDLEIRNFITHADPEVNFHESHDGNPQASPAIELHLTGGPMNFSERFWLWGGNAGWREFELGPVRFVLLDEKYPEDLREKMSSHAATKKKATQSARLVFRVKKDGTVQYEARSLKGAIKKGSFKDKNIKGKQINTGWMKALSTPLRIKVLNYYRYGQNDTRYKPSRIQFGDEAPSSAIELQTREGKRFWMALGDRQVAPLASEKGTHEMVTLHYLQDRRVLPFDVELNRFEITKYQGSQSPMEYSSYVKVHGKEAPKELIHVSMNEPLQFMGYTLYQSSYLPAQPRPTVSIFSVNQDPGRPWKYLGSLLIVLGSVLLFAVKYFKNVAFFDFLRGK